MISLNSKNHHANVFSVRYHVLSSTLPMFVCTHTYTHTYHMYIHTHHTKQTTKNDAHKGYDFVVGSQVTKMIGASSCHLARDMKDWHSKRKIFYF